MLLCVGPEGSGKTLLLKRIVNQNKSSVIDAKTIPTVGVNINTLVQPEEGKPTLYIRELGGSMAPIWHNYYKGVHKVIYVIDAANLIQLGAASLYLLKLLSHIHLHYAKVALVFNKIDCPLPRSVKEQLGVMRLDEVQENVRHEIKTFEVSALTGKGLKPLIKWIKGEEDKKKEKEK